MSGLQFDLPLGDTEVKQKIDSPSGFSVGYKESKLRHGADMADKTYNHIIKGYEDFKDNEDAYTNYIDLWDNNRHRYNTAVKNNIFSLDDDNNVIEGEGHFIGASLLFNIDSVKGALLADRNGLTKDTFENTYAQLTQEEAAQLAKDKEGTSTLGYIGGTIAGYATEPETAIDFASPGKVIGSTILRGAGKAFGIEALFAGASETQRQLDISKHMERSQQEYTLWDSMQEILINSGFAGALRGIGSAVLDWNTIRKINSKIPDKTDKDIFARYAQRENFKLTENSNKHLMLMDKAEADIEAGKNADISGQTDIEINSKTDEAIEEVSFINEISKDKELLEGQTQMNKDFEELKPLKLEETNNPYEGMAEPEEAELLIKEFSNDPEMAAGLKELEELEAQAKPVVKDVE